MEKILENYKSDDEDLMITIERILDNKGIPPTNGENVSETVENKELVEDKVVLDQTILGEINNEENADI